MTEEAKKKREFHPGWKVLGIAFQYVIGPAITTGIASYGIYRVEIQPRVQDDMTKTIEAHSLVQKRLASEPDPTPIHHWVEGPMVMPVPEPTPTLVEVQAKPTPIKEDPDEVPSELLKEWHEKYGEDTGRILKRQWQNQVQEQRTR